MTEWLEWLCVSNKNDLYNSGQIGTRYKVCTQEQRVDEFTHPKAEVVRSRGTVAARSTPLSGRLPLDR